MKKNILYWGEMGSSWSINRTVAQIYALLYLSPDPSQLMMFALVCQLLDQPFIEDDDSSLEKIHWIISNLEIQHKRINSIPTWPWKPETARLVLTAVAVPLILAVLRFLVEQAFFS